MLRTEDTVSETGKVILSFFYRQLLRERRKEKDRTFCAQLLYLRINSMSHAGHEE